MMALAAYSVRLSLQNIQQIRQSDRGVGIGRTGEIVFLGVAIDVGEAVVVAAFEQEVANARVELKACTAHNAVVETVLHIERMLLLMVAVVDPVAVDLAGVAEIVAKLGASVDEELQEAVFLAKAYVHEGRNLQVARLALVHQLRVVLIMLVPATLREVELHLHTAEHAKPTLGDVAGSDAEDGGREVFLLDFGGEYHPAQVHTATHAQRQVVTLLARLRLQRQAGSQQEDSQKIT